MPSHFQKLINLNDLCSGIGPLSRWNLPPASLIISVVFTQVALPSSLDSSSGGGQSSLLVINSIPLRDVRIFPSFPHILYALKDVPQIYLNNTHLFLYIQFSIAPF